MRCIRSGRVGIFFRWCRVDVENGRSGAAGVGMFVPHSLVRVVGVHDGSDTGRNNVKLEIQDVEEESIETEQSEGGKWSEISVQVPRVPHAK